ncbi:MAG: hypothetical protein ACYCQJ_04645 [Nitrososphaerales archaeon]
MALERSNFFVNLKIKEMGSWGKCACGGEISYYSDYGVRCESCQKLYGTWVENLKKAKQEEHQRKEQRQQLLELKKFDDEMLI